MLQGPTLGYIMDTWSLSSDKHNEDALIFCVFKTVLFCNNMKPAG